jgi:hypothetical protein
VHDSDAELIKVVVVPSIPRALAAPLAVKNSQT